ncbi:MAG: PASTA domain-containing protein [Vicinamibacterales bacterium]
MAQDAPKAGPSLRSRSAARAARPHRLRARVWTAGRLLILAGALAATFGIFFLAGLRVATKAREVQVPDVTGQSIAEATAALATVGLTARVDPLRRPDPKVEEDHVISQDPVPGAVTRRQRAVRLRVSDGTHAPVVPSVVGQPERSAEIALAQAGIQIANRAEVRTPDADAIGTVLAQDPPADRQSNTVSLLVSRSEVGGQTFVMPDLIGTLGARAAGVLRGLNFRVTVTAEVLYPGLPPGVVVHQTPQAGFQIGPGQAIALEVSR